MCFWKRRRDDFNHRVFFEAVQFGDIDTVERILAARSQDNQPLRDGNVVDPENGQSGLHIIAMTGNEDMANLLLQKYIADSNIRDKDGRTPLYSAALSGQLKIVRILLAHGARVDLCNNKGQSPFLAACWRGHLAVAKVLVESGANPLLADSEGATAEAMSRRWNHEACAEYCRSLAPNAPAVVENEVAVQIA